jgi:hypothetical protein
MKASLRHLSLGTVVTICGSKGTNIKYGNKIRTEELIDQRITWEIRTRIIARGSLKMNVKNLEL